LFSIRERLTLLGGRFAIDSAPGSGTRVQLVAPRGAAETVAADASSLRAATNVAPDHGARTSANPLKILIVDDHAAVRGTLRQILRARPQFAVVGDAGDGLEAIARARTLQPHVILMDVTMPRMDGIEATRRISAELPDIQILGLSVQPRGETLHAIEHAGAAGFFVKGTDIKRLIEHLLRVHTARSACV
jgi:CheY-like chemotaxis protein